MQPIIDADTHISESAEMWAMFDKEMYGRRPVLLSLPDDTLYGNWNKTWLIDGNIFPKPAGKGGFRLITLVVGVEGTGEPQRSERKLAGI